MRDVNSLEELLAEPEVIAAMALARTIHTGDSGLVLRGAGAPTYLYRGDDGKWDFESVKLLGAKLAYMGAVLIEVAVYAKAHGDETEGSVKGAEQVSPRDDCWPGPAEECQS